MSTAYSRQYHPPAPILSVSFALPDQARGAGPFNAIVDTGADISVAPKSILLDMAAPSVFEAQLRSSWGELHDVIIYLVDLEVESERLPGVHIAGDATATEIILGRNILNKLALFLDGPEHIAQILEGAILERIRARR